MLCLKKIQYFFVREIGRKNSIATKIYSPALCTKPTQTKRSIFFLSILIGVLLLCFGQSHNSLRYL